MDEAEALLMLGRGKRGVGVVRGRRGKPVCGGEV